MPCFPGTVVERSGMSAKDFIFGLSATNGLMLSQIREITNLDTPALQNWVGRNLVPKPVEKRYSVEHLARILIINMLRDVMRLDHIAALMDYLNGQGTKVISEASLYVCACDILDQISYETVLTEEELESVINETLIGYNEGPEKDRIKLGLKIILIYYAASLVKIRGDRLMNKVLEGGFTS